MVEGHTKDRWQHTSNLMALIANINRDPKKGRSFKPSDFNPTISKKSRQETIVVTKENISQLKHAFLGGKTHEK